LSCYEDQCMDKQLPTPPGMPKISKWTGEKS
jgi:hypothetical protein